MNILVYNWRDIKNPEAGGAEVFTHENARRWVEKGNEVTMFTSAFSGCGKEEMVDGISIIRDGGKYSVYWKAKEYYNKYFKGNFDIVIDEINTRPFLTPKFVNNGEKVVALIHQLAREFWFYETGFPANYIGYYFLEERWLRNYINIPTITVSESTKKDLMTLGFNKVSIVPEGINFKPLESLPEKEITPTFIFVGRLKKAKLPDHAIRAFKIIKEKLPDAKLWVVGDGYYRKELEKMSGTGVEFFGSVTQEKKLGLMSKAQAILVPGVREGWGLVVTEANAMGTPAVGYNVHGLRDSIKDGETGLLCEPKPEAMAERALELTRDGVLLERLSRNALVWAGEFNWERSAEEFLRAIEG
ncbi:MAG TPA: glycosyltransferase family 4 protein [Candidatus Methanoperedens sp.]